MSNTRTTAERGKPRPTHARGGRKVNTPSGQTEMLQSAYESSSSKSATVRFLSFVFDEVSIDPIYLCRLKNSDNPGGGGPQHLFTRDPGKIDAFVLKYDEPEYGLYFCVSTVAPDASTRSKETISELTGLHCDIDFKGIIEGEDEVCNKLEQLTLKPSKIVRSGHGLHAYWLLPEVIPATIENIAKVDQLLRMLARHLAGDTAPAHAAALMRLPGTTASTGNGCESKKLFIIRTRNTGSMSCSSG
jgi:hypothetical protein